MPDQPKTEPNQDQDQDEEGEGEGEWIGLVSGLEMGNHQQVGDLRTELMAEWLNGELQLNQDEDDSGDREEAIKVSRLILCGNSLAQPDLSLIDENKKVSLSSSFFSFQ